MSIQAKVWYCKYFLFLHHQCMISWVKAVVHICGSLNALWQVYLFDQSVVMLEMGCMCLVSHFTHKPYYAVDLV